MDATFIQMMALLCGIAVMGNLIVYLQNDLKKNKRKRKRYYKLKLNLIEG